MEDIQRTEHRRVRLQPFPQESLGSIEDNHRVESVLARPLPFAHACPNIDGSESRHRQRFIALDRMARDAVAEVYRPRCTCWNTVSVIGQSGEEAAETTDGDPDADGQHQRTSGGCAHAM